MGVCHSNPSVDPFEEVLNAFQHIQKVADTAESSHCDIIRELENQCKRITGGVDIQFFYSKASTTKIQRNRRQRSVVEYVGIETPFTDFLPLLIQDIEFGKLGYPQNTISFSNRHRMISLLSYTTQLLERNHLQEQAASVISVVEIQREYNQSIPMVIATIADLIKDSLQCQYVSLFKVETSPSKRIIQLFPKHCSITSFSKGILGHVVTEKAFLFFNNLEEKESLGISTLDIEKEVAVDLKEVISITDRDKGSVLCVPIFSNEANDICGIILCLGKGDKAKSDPFSHLAVDLLQILCIEIGHILENNATKLMLDDATEGSNDLIKSLLTFYRPSGSDVERSREPSLTPSISDKWTRKGSLSSCSLKHQHDVIAPNDGNGASSGSRASVSEILRRRLHFGTLPTTTEQIDETKVDELESIPNSPMKRAVTAPMSAVNCIKYEQHQRSNQVIPDTDPELQVVPVPNSMTRENGIERPERKRLESRRRVDSVGMNQTQNDVVVPLRRMKSYHNRRASVSGNLKIAEMMRRDAHPKPVKKSDNPLQQMINMTMDPFAHELKELEKYAMAIFTDLKLLRDLKIPQPPFQCFVTQIMGLYRNSNPYHNVYHGFSVLSFAYSFIKKTDLISKIPALDLFALLVSALCHDVDHPGNTNAFEIATDSELAQKHNDQSVLENHHCNVTFSVMHKAECNFIVEFSNADRKRLRKMVIQSILATDMSHHFELCSTLDQIDKGQFQQSLVKPEKTDKFKQIICNVFVHTADVTAPVQPLVIALNWGKKVCQEFTDQVEKEKELGLESLPMMQELDDQENFLKSQQGFYKFVLRPLFKSVARLWPSLNHLYLQLLNNEQYVNNELEQLQKRRSSPRKMMRRASISSGSTNRNYRQCFSPSLHSIDQSREIALSQEIEEGNLMNIHENLRRSAESMKLI